MQRAANRSICSSLGLPLSLSQGEKIRVRQCAAVRAAPFILTHLISAERPSYFRRSGAIPVEYFT